MNLSVRPHSIRWLVLDETCPCDILIYFRGKYMPLFTKGQKIEKAPLEKLEKARIKKIYISAASEETEWKPWVKSHWATVTAKSSLGLPDSSEDKALYGNKRAELISYLNKSILCRKQSDEKLAKTFETTMELFQRSIRTEGLDWYFRKFHEPPDLFQHGGRVAFGSLLFSFQFGLLSEEERITLCVASLIHELEGNLKENRRTLVSELTLKHLEKAAHPIPQEVLKFIRMQDELWSGQGSPKKLKGKELPLGVCIFSLFNAFDQLRAEKTGTRRVRFDQTKKELVSHAHDYHPDVWSGFWSFWEEDWELVS